MVEKREPLQKVKNSRKNLKKRLKKIQNLQKKVKIFKKLNFCYNILL